MRVSTRDHKEQQATLESAGVLSSGDPARYFVETLGRALDVLEVLRASHAELRLTDIASQARLDISTTFRILRTFEARGYVRRDKKTKKFKHCLGYRPYRIGYSQLSSDQPFSRKVTQGLIEAAEQSRVELLVTDNHDSAEEAVKNAAWLISQRVDFIVEYEFHHRIGPVLSDMFSKARIPSLAIDIPLPGAIYFGANNYIAGSMGGELLARFARQNWPGRVHRLLLLEIPEAGPVPHSRVIGTLEGMRRVLPALDEKRVLHRDGRGTEAGGYSATRRVLATLGRRERLLVAAANDSTARGALRAIREARRTESTAVIAQAWGPDESLEEELGKDDSPMIGSVAYFPERYGAQILPLVLRSLNGQPVAPAVYIEHEVITKENYLRHVKGEVPDAVRTGIPVERRATVQTHGKARSAAANF